MDTAARLIICVILGAFYAPVATAYEWPAQYENLQVVDGDLHVKRPGGGTSHVWPDIKINKEIPVNTSKGGYLVPVEKTFPIPPAKVGKAATRFVRSLPLIATGLAIYDTLCEVGLICEDSGELKQRIMGSADSPYINSPNANWAIYTGSAPGNNLGATATYQQAIDNTYCGAKGKLVRSDMYCVFVSVSSYQGKPQLNYDAFSPSFHPTLRYAVVSVFITGTYTQGPPSYTHRALNESDWTAAETKLNAKPQQTATALYNSDAPVPVLASTQSAPVTKQIAQTSTQTKDALGNITGTQVATTSVKVEDTSTTNNVTYNVTEVTTITTYNENNEITNTQTSTADNQPPKGTDTDETTLSFDDVPNDELEQEEVDLEMPEYESWGEGTCPADVDLGIYGLSISYKPACDVAADLRPFFLLLASVTGMFIIAGISTKE